MTRTLMIFFLKKQTPALTTPFNQSEPKAGGDVTGCEHSPFCSVCERGWKTSYETRNVRFKNIAPHKNSQKAGVQAGHIRSDKQMGNIPPQELPTDWEHNKRQSNIMIRPHDYREFLLCVPKCAKAGIKRKEVINGEKE